MTKYTRPNNKYPKNWNKLRFAIFVRDRYFCQMCGIKCRIGGGLRSPQCHHLTPINCGGTNHWSNLVTLCKRCHELVHKEWLEKKRNGR